MATLLLILSLLLLFIAFSLFLFLLLLSLYLKRRRRRTEPSESSPQQAAEAEEEEAPLVAAVGGEEGEGGEKRRKKRGKKKRQETAPVSGGSGGGGEEGGRDPTAAAAEAAGKVGVGPAGAGGKVNCPYPFSSFASATQRKIKAQYDELVKSNQAKALTMTQVGQFVNCLVEARNELQHKSEIIQRSFKIKKALLFKADRSSFDRLCQQIYKLEAEHKRLEEDAAVYNLLQEQLKLSPAYKTMLEVGASMELKGTPEQAMDFCDISFEELLAQEKKDSFWQRNGRLRSLAS